jgi:hypothetical protein
MNGNVTPSVWMASKPVEVTATVLVDNPDWEHTLDTLLKAGKFEMRVPLAAVYNLLDSWAVAVDTVFWSPCVHEVGGEGNPVPGVKLQLPASAGVRERLKDYNGAPLLVSSESIVPDSVVRDYKAGYSMFDVLVSII